MPIDFPVSGHWENTRPIQYVAEGLTPATFGVTPTASPTFTVAAAVQDIQDIPAHDSFIKRQIGKREYYKDLTIKNRITFELKFAPYNVTLMKYGSEPAAGAGTIAESLSFLKSKRINNSGTLTENFWFYKGCRMSTLDINVAGKEVEVTSNWVAKSKVGPLSAHGLTTPTLRTFSDVSATPWTHLDNGTNPLTIDAVTYPCTKFHINWNNELALDDDVNGDIDLSMSTQGNRVITGDFEVIVGKDLNLEADIVANPMPAVAASYVLKTATATINMTDLSIKQATDKDSSGDSKSWRIPYTFECSNALIA